MNRHYEDNPLYEVYFFCVYRAEVIMIFVISARRSPHVSKIISHRNEEQERVLQQNKKKIQFKVFKVQSKPFLFQSLRLSTFPLKHSLTLNHATVIAGSLDQKHRPLESFLGSEAQGRRRTKFLLPGQALGSTLRRREQGGLRERIR